MVNLNLAPDIRVTRWRIKLDIFLPLALIGFAASTLSVANQIDSLRAFIFHTFMNIAGYAGTFLFWRLSGIFLDRRDKPYLPLWQILGIGALGGLVFTVSESAAAWLFQVEPSGDFLIEVISYSIPAAFWLPASSVISGNYRRYLKIRNGAQEALLHQESIRQKRDRALDEYRKKIEGQIQDWLLITTQEAAKVFAELDRGLVSDLPGQLRAMSSQYFRLASHKMNSSNDVQERGLRRAWSASTRVTKSILQSVETRPLYPLWYATILAVTLIPFTVKKFELITSVEIFLVVGISSLFLQTAQLKIAQYFKVDLLRLAIVALLLNIIIPIILVRLLPSLNSQPFYPFGFMIVVLAINFLGHLAQSGLLTRLDMHERLFSEVEKVKIDEKEASLLFARITKNWAKYVHGAFTSKLEACALALETALKEDDLAEVERTISEVGKLLKAEKFVQPVPQLLLLDEIEERCKNWDGIIEFEIKSNIERENIVGVSVQQVGACVEEAILNASRHGNCRWIGIEIVNTEMLFQVIIKDNGVGFTTHKQGFGSGIFTEATEGHWDIWRREAQGLTILHLNFRKVL